MDPATLEGRHSSNKAVLCLVGNYTVQERETDENQKFTYRKFHCSFLSKSVRCFVAGWETQLATKKLPLSMQHYFMQEDTQWPC